MSKDWESTFASWAGPPSDTQKEKSENAERMIRKAVEQDAALSRRSVRVFTQGSYRNNTNVKQESDVDIGVCCEDLINPDYTFVPDVGDSDVGLVDSSYSAAQFKNDLERALRAYFGPSNVSRGSKAFDIHANSYRTDADVVACIEHRRYTRGTDDRLYRTTGVAIWADDGSMIINWPEQHYDNGVKKNQDTSLNFKRAVRILKKLRNRMADERVQAAAPIPSYLIECLVWNVPNDGFAHNTYSEDVRYALVHLFNATIGDASCKEWGEVNELKYLFRSGQPWTLEQAHSFLRAAWQYLGLE
jgi:hypothetical protein